MMELFSRVAMAAAMTAFATTALAQTAETALPEGLQWAVSPQSYLAKRGWGTGTQGDAGNGIAVVTCAYDARGALSNCQAIDERPVGFALGATAAFVATKRAKLKRTRTDGSALTPGRITFTVVFREEDRSRLGTSSWEQQTTSTRAQDAARDRAHQAAVRNQ